MVRRWVKYLGLDEATKLMTWNNTDPGFSLRFYLQEFLFFFHSKERKVISTVTHIIVFLMISGPIREGALQDQTLWSV